MDDAEAVTRITFEAREAILFAISNAYNRVGRVFRVRARRYDTETCALRFNEDN